MVGPCQFLPSANSSQGTQGSNQYRRTSFRKCDKWDQIVKHDSNARCMCGKYWPYWNDWTYIFGKDRASGGGSEDVSQVEKNFQQEELNADVEGYDDYHMFLEDTLAEEPVQSNNLKCKRTDEGADLLNLLGKLHAEINSRLDTLSARIGYDMDLGKARQEIFCHLDNMSGLSDAQRYDILHVISSGRKTQDWRSLWDFPTSRNLAM
ncbi:hypothetical protein AAHA92_16481 [Salvia divinorum]|uniref:Uncharacterized protein n=1 Tax=Salvia divinorum TaxID=28513 RepID=A0ABD1GW46_SALDI